MKLQFHCVCEEPEEITMLAKAADMHRAMRESLDVLEGLAVTASNDCDEEVFRLARQHILYTLEKYNLQDMF